MDTNIKFPIRLDKINECIEDASGYVLLRYTWGITPADFLRRQEAKAQELVTIANFHYAVTAKDPDDESPHADCNGTGPALPVEVVAKAQPKKRGNPNWIKGWKSKK